MRRQMFALLMMVVVLFGAVAVSSAQEITIGLSIPQVTEEGFFATLVTEAQAAADAADAALSVLSAELDPAVEAENIAQLIADNVSVLLIYPIDPALVLESVAAANAAGIPVVLLGADVEREESEAEVAAVVSADPAAVGELAAATLCEALEGAGTVAVLVAISGLAEDAELSMEDYRVVERAAQLSAFETAMADTCAGVTLLIEETGTYTNAESEAFFATALENGAGAALTFNADLALSALTIARQARVRGLEIVTLGVTPNTLGAVESGRITGIISPTPESLGLMGVETAVAVFGGEMFEALIAAELAVVTQDAVAGYRPCDDC